MKRRRKKKTIKNAKGEEGTTGNKRETKKLLKTFSKAFEICQNSGVNMSMHEEKSLLEYTTAVIINQDNNSGGESNQQSLPC